MLPSSNWRKKEFIQTQDIRCIFRFPHRFSVFRDQNQEINICKLINIPAANCPPPNKKKPFAGLHHRCNSVIFLIIQTVARQSLARKFAENDRTGRYTSRVRVSPSGAYQFDTGLSAATMNADATSEQSGSSHTGKENALICRSPRFHTFIYPIFTRIASI